ncbi:MAG: transposase, partial [Planctomycetota bacterium]
MLRERGDRRQVRDDDDLMAPRDRERLEALCRFAARPAVSESRLAELPDGRIGYALKRRFADGTT